MATEISGLKEKNMEAEALPNARFFWKQFFGHPFLTDLCIFPCYTKLYEFRLKTMNRIFNFEIR